MRIDPNEISGGLLHTQPLKDVEETSDLAGGYVIIVNREGLVRKVIPSSLPGLTPESKQQIAELVSSMITKDSVGLGNVDNTSDEDKPISSSTQSALDEIMNLIPVEATPANKLADKNYVNSQMTGRLPERPHVQGNYIIHYDGYRLNYIQYEESIKNFIEIDLDGMTLLEEQAETPIPMTEQEYLNIVNQWNEPYDVCKSIVIKNIRFPDGSYYNSIIGQAVMTAEVDYSVLHIDIYPGIGTLYHTSIMILSNRTLIFSYKKVEGGGGGEIPSPDYPGEYLISYDGDRTTYESYPDSQWVYRIQSPEEREITLHNRVTSVFDDPISTMIIHFDSLAEGFDFNCGIIFRTVENFQLSVEPPPGFSCKWCDAPIFETGKVYEVSFRCLWIHDMGGNYVISARFSEAAV